MPTKTEALTALLADAERDLFFTSLSAQGGCWRVGVLRDRVASLRARLASAQAEA